MLSDIELEELEKRYLDYIVTSLRGDLKGVIDGLNSRIQILNDWKEQFLKTARKGHKQPSDLDAGAERIFHHFFKRIFEFPNTSPIGADLMYYIQGEAVIHIEIKTNVITNTDYKGKIQLGRNQTSYKTSRFKPNLPSFYESVKIPTLTYAIQIIHEHMCPKINALNVICIPNGRLLKYYGENILQAGKGGRLKATDIRYNYARQPYFLLLKERDKRDIFRIEILILEKSLSIHNLTGKDLPIIPYKIID
jgi:hypothetical protein